MRSIRDYVYNQYDYSLMLMQFAKRTKVYSFKDTDGCLDFIDNFIVWLDENGYDYETGVISYAKQIGRTNAVKAHMSDPQAIKLALWPDGEVSIADVGELLSHFISNIVQEFLDEQL